MVIRASARPLEALYARASGEMLDMPGAAAAADDGFIIRAAGEDFIAQPAGTLLLRLPHRSPYVYENRNVRALDSFGGEAIDAVAAALPLGYTRTLLPAYTAREGAPPLPLYGYAAVAWAEDGVRVAAARTDELETWSLQSHSSGAIERALAEREAEFPHNQLLTQLRRCALEYGCFTAQNAFLRQGEAALPVSPACNARCIGCISEQDPNARVKSAQERVRSLPLARDVCEVAVAHLNAAPHGIVSFGQGCEGEPLLAAPLIEQCIRAIRAQTSAGMIHCNTNASRPRALARLLDAGLQSIRVSLNSARPNVYEAYYRPRGYGFADVCASLDAAARAGAATSLNLLTHPGISDDRAETAALTSLLRQFPIRMLQTRTLNVDPETYFAAVGRPSHRPLGMRQWLARLRSEFPGLRIGNFTRGFG